MRILILIVATAALLLENVAAEEDGIKRGVYPYMAFVYYPDDSVVNSAGGKFFRSAVLIRENYLITSSLESENSPIAFPEKTLVARLGATSIDDKLNLNEDEDEQEREIIRIIRPSLFNSSQWWNSDISLLKTLSPFNITLVVSPIETITTKLSDKQSCFMLLYAKQNENTTEARILMKISVEIISSPQDTCGTKFNNDKMVCAAPVADQSDVYKDPNFCMDNNGGPLMCNNELTGIQTYIDNCSQPYLYQLLYSWDDLISCAIEEKSLDDQCSKICHTINKDPVAVATADITIVTIEPIMKLADGYINESDVEVFIASTLSTDKSSDVETVSVTLATAAKEDQATTEMTTLSTVSYTNTDYTTVKSSEHSEKETTHVPVEREREINVEAQQHKLRSAASRNVLYLLKYFVYVFFVLVRLH